ncbi:hypothetical protein FHS15_000927 [Paenibacillus castaneae]|uniref:S-layer homology domain-containing protein n=1 Tax=Paenibacillus castaneae TaxID=474957 RepID=UPI000C99F634|nr:S-layer homology domain-containing protein [Paenibacillus castaneae]NIK75827.1 hypothetical protein [Paenibacillus castaneae]
MRKRSLLIMALIAMMLFSVGQTVFAFKDIKNDANEHKINELKKHGIIKGGNKEDKFNPKGKLSYAEGISLIVKGMGLNIDNIRFIKEPLASDSYPNLKDKAWYSEAFVIANYNGLDIPKTVKANDNMTREQFAHHLFKAIVKKGDYAFVEMYAMIKDEADINNAYKNSIQKLLIAKIATLDSSNKFYPKQAITRSTAAGWLYDAITFVKETKPIPEQPVQPNLEYKLIVTPVNTEVNKVTVSTQVPHPGYGIRISSISFEGKEAVIHIEIVMPDPDKMYPQVITDVQVTTYVDATFKPVLPVGSQLSSSSSSTGIIAK